MKLRELRKNLKITQAELASQLGISRDTYKNYEQERTQMNYEMLIRVADYFNVSLDYLCGRQNKNLIFADSLSEKKKELINLIKDLDDDSTLIALGFVAKLANKPIDEVLQKIK